MADEKIITSSVFEQGITEIMQDIANNLYEFEEYTEEEVANLIDLSEEEVAELARVINDTTVALNKVYSNKKVEDLLTELEVTCNKYADEKIGGLAGIHLAYVDTLPATGEDNVIYILKSTTGGNDTLNLYNNGWISIGEFTISLDNYYDKTEVDTLLNDKANKNEVVSQNDVVSDMSNVSSSTVLSTAGLDVELEKKVDKDSIATVLDDSVTDEQVPSAKAVEERVKNMCTTTVADVGKTLITFPDSTNHKVVTSAETYYIVKNGICYIHLAFGCVLKNATTTITGLPLPLANTTVYAPQAVPYDYSDLTSIRVRVSVSPYGVLNLVGGTAGVSYICSFSYPVAE